jgi:uncharacterized membrane protein
MRKRAELKSSRVIEVCPIGESILSVNAQIGAKHLEYPTASFDISLKNETFDPITNITMSISSPQGIAITDPGDIFGNSWRQTKINVLAGHQSVSYKLGVRIKEESMGGELIFDIKAESGTRKKEKKEIRITIPVKVERI